MEPCLEFTRPSEQSTMKDFCDACAQSSNGVLSLAYRARDGFTASGRRSPRLHLPSQERSERALLGKLFIVEASVPPNIIEGLERLFEMRY